MLLRPKTFRSGSPLHTHQCEGMQSESRYSLKETTPSPSLSISLKTLTVSLLGLVALGKARRYSRENCFRLRPCQSHKTDRQTSNLARAVAQVELGVAGGACAILTFCGRPSVRWQNCAYLSSTSDLDSPDSAHRSVRSVSDTCEGWRRRTFWVWLNISLSCATLLRWNPQSVRPRGTWH